MQPQDSIKIIVLDRGFVFVARCPEVSSAGMWVTVQDARCIRQWGTTEGLGELASGPTSETRLDRQVKSLTFPIRAFLFTIDDVDQAAWEPHLTTSEKTKTRRRS